MCQLNNSRNIGLLGKRTYTPTLFCKKSRHSLCTFVTVHVTTGFVSIWYYQFKQRHAALFIGHNALRKMAKCMALRIFIFIDSTVVPVGCDFGQRGLERLLMAGVY